MTKHPPARVGVRGSPQQVIVTLPPGVNVLAMTPEQARKFVDCLRINLKKLPRSRRASVVAHSDVQEAFDYWKQVMGHPRALLTPERERRIKLRLTEGRTMTDIKRAIDGCKASPHHQGQNQHGMMYDDIELICRTGAKLEQFMEIVLPKARYVVIAQHSPDCACAGTGMVTISGGAKRCGGPKEKE